MRSSSRVFFRPWFALPSDAGTAMKWSDCEPYCRCGRLSQPLSEKQRNRFRRMTDGSSLPTTWYVSTGAPIRGSGKRTTPPPPGPDVPRRGSAVVQRSTQRDMTGGEVKTRGVWREKKDFSAMFWTFPSRIVTSESRTTAKKAKRNVLSLGESNPGHLRTRTVCLTGRYPDH